MKSLEKFIDNYCKVNHIDRRKITEEDYITIHRIWGNKCFYECENLAIKIKALKAENCRIKSENASLREQISKMIVPPCTLGDTLYILSFCFGDGYDEAGNATHTCGWQISETKVDEKNFYKMCDLVRNGKAFFSREAAEAYVAELKGEKDAE